MWRVVASGRWQSVAGALRCHAAPRLQNQRSSLSSYLYVNEEVAASLQAHRPVVALESTIITHGMPYPENLNTAQMVESVVREHGAVPATVAVLRGQVHVGLTESELKTLAQGETTTVKTSRRDMPYVVSQKKTGGTTVSGTMIAAHHAGIPVFVTGGVGGVHRGAETSMDVSADLRELGRTPVAVISAGVKSILDIGRTLEYLETEGVCVATYGETRDFPAFLTPRSGHQAPYNVTTPLEAAQMIHVSLSLGLGSGLMIAVPIPEEEAAAAELTEKATSMALKEAIETGVTGKEVTPYVLNRVNEMTSGQSLTANISLIKNNARVGSLIACELAKIQQQASQGRESMSYGGRRSPISSRTSPATSESSNKSATQKRPVVVGGVNIDFTSRFKVSDPKPNGATYPGEVYQSFGGVGRNISSCLSCFGCNPLFLTAVGTDAYADFFCHQSEHMDLSAIRQSEVHPSAVYCAVIQDNGELIYGLGDFKVHGQITKDYVSSHEAALAGASLVCCDGNLPVETIAYISDVCYHNQVPVWFEPTDMHHATKPALCGADRRVTYMSPNVNELRTISDHLRGAPPGLDPVFLENLPIELYQTLNELMPRFRPPEKDLEDDRDATIAWSLELVRPLLEKTPNIMVTLGHFGAMLCSRDEGKAFYCPSRPANKPPPKIASVSGAGDCLAAGYIAGIIENRGIKTCLKAGILASQHSLLSHHAVPLSMTPDIISDSAISELDEWEIKEYDL